MVGRSLKRQSGLDLMGAQVALLVTPLQMNSLGTSILSPLSPIPLPPLPLLLLPALPPPSLIGF